MKFGKSYQETIASPSFPDDWRRGAIEYKQLKKLINGVVAELESLGLSAAVLRELLVEQKRIKDARASTSTPTPTPTTTPSATVQPSPPSAPPVSCPAPRDRDCDRDRDGPADADAPAPAPAPVPLPAPGQPPRSAKDWLESVPHSAHHRGRLAHPDDASSLSAAASGSGAATIHSGSAFIGSSRASTRSTHATSPPRSPGPCGPSALPSLSWCGSAATESEVECELDDEHTDWVEGSEGRRAHAAYELGGTAEHPVPRIRITIESPVTTSDEEESDDQVEEVRSAPVSDPIWSGADAYRPARQAVLADTSLAVAERQHEAEQEERADHEGIAGADGEDELEAGNAQGFPPSPPAPNQVPSTSRDTHSSQTQSVALRKASLTQDGCTPLASPPSLRPEAGSRPGASVSPPRPNAGCVYPSDLGDSEEDEDLAALRVTTARLAYSPAGRKARKKAAARRERRVRVREMTIPLVADELFLTLFTSALVAVQSVQALQRTEFITATERLTKAVADASSPYGSQSDLYTWRAIFSLWSDSQVFESTREKDAGELDVDESERRLIGFANQLYRRGWLQGPITPSRVDTKDVLPHPSGSGRGASSSAQPGPAGLTSSLAALYDSSSTLTLTEGRHEEKLSPRSAQALTDFLTLNVALLDVKKYQRLNLEAARKILKKHDKRTALTAGTGLRTFMAQHEHDRVVPVAEQAGEEACSPVPTDPAAITDALASGEAALDSSRLRRLVRFKGKKAAQGVAASMPPLDRAGPVPSGAEWASGARARALAPIATAVPSLEALLPLTGPGGVLSGGRESESLAHILFSLMSSQLLPILPSLDDYSCSICLDVAWRPIRLDCQHLFCIRCLVKLQKQGRRACPLCRAPDAVGCAGERHLDTGMSNMLKVWFPREVRAKERDNDRDRRQEERRELGLNDSQCMVM